MYSPSSEDCFFHLSRPLAQTPELCACMDACTLGWSPKNGARARTGDGRGPPWWVLPLTRCSPFEPTQSLAFLLAPAPLQRSNPSRYAARHRDPQQCQYRRVCKFVFNPSSLFSLGRTVCRKLGPSTVVRILVKRMCNVRSQNSRGQVRSYALC